MTREDAYAAVQRNAMASWERGLPFRDLLRQDGEITARIGDAELDEAFRVENFLRHVDYIFNRVFGGEA
jgi:adenylosuccinate lyase